MSDMNPAPNWCPTCGKRPDDLYSLFCSDGFHNRNRALAQPAEAVEGGLGRFGHHPDPATDFEVEVESLQGRLFNARHSIAKMGERPETVAAVTDAIERAMRFKVGGDPGAVYAKSLLRALEQEAKPTDAAQGAVAWMNKHGSVMTDELKTEFIATGVGFRVDAEGYDKPLYTHQQAAPAQVAVAWYVFADTEKWVTLDRSEADDQRGEGCQVRPLIFGDTHQQAAPAQGDDAFLRRGLWECFKLAGGDTDGASGPEAIDNADLAIIAVRTVRDLRECYDELAAAPSQEGES